MVSEKPEAHTRHHYGTFVAWLILRWSLAVMGRRGCGVMNSLGWHADQVDKTLEQLGGVKKIMGKWTK